MEFSISKMKQMIKDESDKRVAEDSADHLRSILERFAGDIAEEAIALAKEDGRKTVQERDIKEALR